MIISNKQVMELYLIAVDSLLWSENIGFNRDERQILVDQIINQQSDELMDLKDSQVEDEG